MLTKLAQLINRVVQSWTGTFVERPSDLTFSGVLSGGSFAMLEALFADIEAAGWFESIHLVDSDEAESLPLTEVGRKIGSNVRLSLLKPCGDDLVFLTTKGFCDSIGRPEVEAAKRIRVFADFEPFNSETSIFLRLDDAEPAESYVTTIYDKPRKLVTDTAGDILPNAFGPWLLRGEAPKDSEVFAAWRFESALRLSQVFASELSRSGGQKTVIVSGPRKQEAQWLVPDQSRAAAVFPTMQEAARWILESEREVRTRQKYLAGELAREWRENLDWFAGLAAYLMEAFEAARLAFDSYFDKEARDSLKALSDLKKAVTDSALQIASQTQALTHQVSNDFAIVFAAILVRHSGMVAGTLKGDAAFFAYMFVVAFILMRMYFSVRNASASITNQRNARKAWNNKIHFYLTKTDFDDLAVKPISDAETTFSRTRILVIGAYFMLIALLTITWSGLHVGATLQRIIQFFLTGQCVITGDWIV